MAITELSKIIWPIPKEFDLYDLKARGHTVEEIAVITGRTYSAIWRKFRRLGLRPVSKPRLHWPDQRTNRLKYLHSQGWSASEIARDLGDEITRNAVIGKVHRLGLSDNRKISSPEQIVARQEKRRAAQMQSRQAYSARRAGFKPDRAPHPINELPSDVSPFSVSIADLQPGHCRWPVSGGTEFMYCGGGKVEGCSYCRRHRRIAFVQPRYVRKAPPRFSFAMKQRWRAT